MKIQTKSNSGLTPKEINERNEDLKTRIDNYNSNIKSTK